MVSQNDDIESQNYKGKLNVDIFFLFPVSEFFIINHTLNKHFSILEHLLFSVFILLLTSVLSDSTL